VPAGQADPEALRGRGDGAGDAARPGVEQKSGQGTTTTPTAGATGTVDQGDPGGTSDDVGNAPGGDDSVDDERRGPASIDDDEHHDEGHYEVPALSLQILEGLAQIVRDDDGSGAATYAWDFTLYRPGIYGKKQPAERLFHLVVQKASAFDPLWEQARQALNEKLERVEPDALLLEPDDFARALRIARVR
jgi:hypothetical protein